MLITKKIKCGLILIMLVLFFTTGCSKKPTGNQNGGIPVTVAQVVQQAAPLNIKSFGTAEAYSTVAVKSRVTGILMKVHFVQGQLVKKDDILLSIDPRPFEAVLKGAQANFSKDSFLLANAEKELARQAELLKKGYASQDDYDISKTAADSLRATVESDAAAVELAKLSVDYCTIKSPIEGLAGMLLVNEGNLVSSDNTTVVTLNQIKPIYVTFTVPGEYLPQIQKYMGINKLKVVAQRPLGDEQEFEGNLTFVDNAVDTSTGTIKLRGTFENEDGKLWPGQFTNITLTLTQEPNSIVVPLQAVQNSQQGQYVYVVKPDNTVEFRIIKIVRTISNGLVVDGLKAGDTIVTDGQLRLVNGSKIQIRDANNNKK
jgi:multidrug efflux system membrane fusion protein